MEAGPSVFSFFVRTRLPCTSVVQRRKKPTQTFPSRLRSIFFTQPSGASVFGRRRPRPLMSKSTGCPNVCNKIQFKHQKYACGWATGWVVFALADLLSFAWKVSPEHCGRKSWHRLRQARKRTAAGDASQYVVGKGPPRRRHDCERRH